MRLFTECIAANEEVRFDKVLQTVKKRMSDLYGTKERAYRDTHTKTHACVNAALEIYELDEQSIKDQLVSATKLTKENLENAHFKLGLFKSKGQYKALLRFANGGVSIANDRRTDTRSMSVKIYGVSGSRHEESYDDDTQDLITQNSEIFFVKGTKDYNSFFKAVAKSGFSAFLWLITHPEQAFYLYKTTQRKPLSLLTESYWSGSAFSIGERISIKQNQSSVEITYPLVIKCAFLPISSDKPFGRLESPNRPRDIGDNYYRNDLIQRLSKDNAKYYWDFAIQVQTCPELSIENVTKRWKEEESPFITVGRLSVTSQAIDYGAQYDDCENLKFSPWNGLKVHSPVGQLNRLRKIVYPVVAEYRQKKRLEGGSAQNA